MKWVKVFFPVILTSLLLLLTYPVLAEESNEESDEDVNQNQKEEAFQLLDTEKDGMICREEWEAIDKDKDNTICQDEWKRWEFKHEDKSKGLTQKFDLKWYDNNGDGFMTQEEYNLYPPGVPGGKRP
jgi:Ca2+-binding EF-hand superfamily protein